MKTYTQSELKNILSLHKKCLYGHVDGVRANISEADLRDANFRDLDLRGIRIKCANLNYVDIRDANLEHANLRGSNLTHSNLSGAKLKGADIRDANLEHANLSYADLRDANFINTNIGSVNLLGTVGNNKEIKSLQVFEEYHVCYTKDRLQIGCKNHSFDEWRSFSDDEIDRMDPDKALCFWTKNKGYIFETIKQYPAV